MKKLKRISFIVFVLFMISTAMFGKSSKRTNIPKFVIQYGINKKFPMTRTVSEEKIVLKNPKIDFKGNKVYLESNYQFSSPERKSKGKFYLSSDFKYDKQKEVAHLLNFSFDSIIDTNGNEIKNSDAGKSVETFVMKEIKKYLTYNYGSKYEKRRSLRRPQMQFFAYEFKRKSDVATYSYMHRLSQKIGFEILKTKFNSNILLNKKSWV